MQPWPSTSGLISNKRLNVPWIWWSAKRTSSISYIDVCLLPRGQLEMTSHCSSSFIGHPIV